MKNTKSSLPPGILQSDLEYPKSGDIAYDCGGNGQLIFYDTAAFGWCLATLAISSGRRRNTTDRTYATRISDGASVRVGSGPHVTRTITVYVAKSRMEALKVYTEMFVSGQLKANAIRDRISSRRAQGVEMRAQGRSSWRWGV